MIKTMLLAAVVAGLVVTARAQIDVAPGFEVDMLDRAPSEVPARLEAVRNADYGEDGAIGALIEETKLGVFIVTESGLGLLDSTDGFPLGSEVVDLRFDATRLFDNRLFVTIVEPELLPSPGGLPGVFTELYFVDPHGTVEPIETFGQRSERVRLYLDFFPEIDGFTPGMYLYDGDISAGTPLFYIAPDFTPSLVGADVIPPGRRDMDARGMEFDPTREFSNFLTIADADDHDDHCGIVVMRPDLAMADVGSAVSLGEREYADMAFSRGGDFGEKLYVADRVENYVFIVDPSGDHEPFAKGFVGISSITVNNAGTKMYVSDAEGIYRIQAVPPEPNAFAPCAAVSAGVSASGPVNATFINVGQPVIGRSDDTDLVMYAGVGGCFVGELVEPVAGDCNADRIVDLTDYACFFDCVSGPDGGVRIGCGFYDFDIDIDIDNRDFWVFQTLLTLLSP